MLDGFGDVPLCVALDIDSYDGPGREIARFRDASGWLQVSDIKLFTGEEIHATTVVAACDEYGAPHEDWYATRLFKWPCQTRSHATSSSPAGSAHYAASSPRRSSDNALATAIRRCRR